MSAKSNKEIIVTLETANLAKKAGFDWLCQFCYDKCDILASYLKPEQIFSGINYNSGAFVVSAPTQSLLQKWLRDVQDFDLEFGTTFSRKYSFIGYKGMKPVPGFSTDDYDTYEEALEEALKIALSLIKTVSTDS